MTTVTSPTAPSAAEVGRFCSAATPTAAGPTHTHTHTETVPTSAPRSPLMCLSVRSPPLSLASSSRCFCVDCLDILVDPGASNNARYLDPWRCYMCQPLLQYGVLKRRHDWSLKLQEFFANDKGQEFVSLSVKSVFMLCVSGSQSGEGKINLRGLWYDLGCISCWWVDYFWIHFLFDPLHVR